MSDAPDSMMRSKNAWWSSRNEIKKSSRPLKPETASSGSLEASQTPENAGYLAVSADLTLNLGDYRMGYVGASLSLPVQRENRQAVYDICRTYVEALVRREVKQLKSRLEDRQITVAVPEFEGYADLKFDFAADGEGRPGAFVSADHGMREPMGNFESAKFSVRMGLPISPDEATEAYDAVSEQVRVWVEAQIAEVRGDKSEG